jgi:peptidoglycan/LPS O-acetylase OafA/YrhL
LFAGDIPAWAYALGLQNFWMAAEQTYGARWLAVTWSLAVEEQFYLIFPLVVYFARGSTVLRLCLALLIICPIARIATWALGDGLGCYVLTPMRADVIAMGVIVACLQQSAEMVTYRRLAAVTFIAALCLLPLFTFDSGSIDSKMALWAIRTWSRFLDRWSFSSSTRTDRVALDFYDDRSLAFSPASPMRFTLFIRQLLASCSFFLLTARF